VHADAVTIDMTDWVQILALYDHLFELTPTPVVALNRCIALAEVRGPAIALSLVDEIDLAGYYLFHATRGELLRRLQRHDQASAAYGRAAELAPSVAERSLLEDRRTAARSDDGP